MGAQRQADGCPPCPAQAVSAGLIAPLAGQIRRPSYSLAIVKTKVVFVLAGDRAISRILADLCPARWFGGREMLTLLLVSLIRWLSLVIRKVGEVPR